MQQVSDFAPTVRNQTFELSVYSLSPLDGTTDNQTAPPDNQTHFTVITGHLIYNKGSDTLQTSFFNVNMKESVDIYNRFFTSCSAVQKCNGNTEASRADNIQYHKHPSCFLSLTAAQKGICLWLPHLLLLCLLVAKRPSYSMWQRMVNATGLSLQKKKKTPKTTRDNDHHDSFIIGFKQNIWNILNSYNQPVKRHFYRKW